MNDDFMVGFAQGIPAAIKGYYDIKDQQYREMEFKARQKAQDENAERQRRRDELEMAENSPERRREKMQFELAKSGMEGQFDENNNFVSAQYRPDYLALKRKIEQSSANNVGAKPLTPGQKSADQRFGKDYNDFILGGGYANVQANLKTLRDLADQAENSNNLSGPVIDKIPFKSVLAPSAMDAQDRVRSVIMQSLRDTLGAQFTEKEGENLIKTAWNPALDEKTNAKRLRQAIAKIENMVAAKQAAADYFEQFGTMQGYKGPRIETLRSEIAGDESSENWQGSAGIMKPGLLNKAKGLIQPEAQAAPSGPRIGDIEDGHRYVGGDPANPKSWQKVK